MPEVAKQVETGEIRMASLARELEGAEGEDLPIVAPYDGTVIRLGPRRAGVVIERGEVLCELARAGGQLRAELAVPERDAGRLAPGQPVRLLLSSFPHTRYGARPGTLLWVSPAAAGTGPGTSNGATFRAIASLEDLEIVVAGERRPLRAGMGGEARIVTQNLTLLELAFEPMRALKENLGSSP
jgi:multidrug efflux pump subunit AcrA (membrane-fusion protein)